MRRIRVKAHELLDVDVDLISLVKRPSTRIPFPVIKSQDAKGGFSMFDLAQVFRAKSEAQAPVVTSVIVKGEASAALLTVLKDQGFSVEKAETENGITVYPQDVAYNGEVSVVKLNDTLALTVPAIKADGSFAEMCAARGFYPALNIAVDLLNCQLYSAVEKSDSPQVAAQKVQTVVSDFGTFMSSLVGALPSQVFKTEDAVANAGDTPAEETTTTEAAPAAEAAPAETSSETGPNSQGAEPSVEQHSADVEPAPVDTGEHNDPAPAHESETNPIRDAAADAENPANEPSPAVGTVETDDPANLPAEGFVEGQPGIERVAKDEIAEIVAAAVKAAVAPLNDEIASLRGGVKKAEEKLGNVVFGGVFDTDREPAPVEKTEHVGLIDTGRSLVGTGGRKLR